ALFRRLGYSDDKVVVIVNRHQSADVVSAADAAGVLGRSIFFRLPNEYKTATAAVTKGVSVITHDAGSALAHGFGQLASRLDGTASANGERVSNGQARGGLGRLFSFGRKS